MPTCEKCNQKWSWKQTIKNTNTLNPAMTCPYCGEKQYESQKSRNISFFFYSIMLVPLLLQIFIDLPKGSSFVLFFLLLMFEISLYPFFVRISSKEEYVDFYKNKMWSYI